jgi:DNA-binding MurR/RpiR family transcriptional regulator
MKGHRAKLPRKQHQAIAALIKHQTTKEAAEDVGIGEATLFRWMQDHDFQKAYREAKRRVMDHAITQLQQVSSEAVLTLQAIMNDTEKPPSPRVTAARTILDMAVKAVELEDLTARIEALEKKVSTR